MVNYVDNICGVVIDGQKCQSDRWCRTFCLFHYKQDCKGEILRWPQKRRKNSEVLKRNLLNEKQCLNCKLWYPESFYRIKKRTADSLNSNCSSCLAILEKTWRENNPHKTSGYTKKKKYGITVDQYEDMFNSQKQKCKICGIDNANKWVIDHDHAHHINSEIGCIDCIRGILCNNCNLMLGHARDNVTILKAAIDYLS